MKLELHPSAQKAFDEQAAGFRTTLSTTLIDQENEGTGRVFSNLYIDGEISEKDVIGPITSSRTNAFGEEIARFLYTPEGVVGIEGEAFRDLRRLAEKIQRTPDLRDAVSVETVFSKLFEWVCASETFGDSHASATSFVLRECEKSISTYRLLIPIYELFLEEPLQIGRVVLRPLTGDEIDDWLRQISSSHPEMTSTFETEINRKRKEMQGRAVAEVSIVAERQRAEEIAHAQTSDSLALLRLFSRAAFEPTETSFCVPLGRQHVEVSRHILFQNGDYIGESSKITNVGSGMFWTINREVSHIILDAGLRILSNLLISPSLTDFEQKLLDSVFLYSRATLQSELSERLLYIVVALESFMLRNNSEPILGNVAERVAFTIGRSSEERRQISRDIKAAYDLRSRFVHHGHASDDLACMRTFMRHAHTCLTTLVANCHRFKTRDELFEVLEERKFA